MQGDALMIYTASAVMIYNLTVDDMQSGKPTDCKTPKTPFLVFYSHRVGDFDKNGENAKNSQKMRFIDTYRHFFVVFKRKTVLLAVKSHIERKIGANSLGSEKQPRKPSNSAILCDD